MPETQTGQLISIGGLANRLGIARFHVQRALSKGLFPYIQDPLTKYRFVPVSDYKTLELLDRAAEIFKTSQPSRLTFASAIRLAKRGYVVRREVS